MSDCSTRAFGVPEFAWRELPDGRSVLVGEGKEPHVIELKMRSGGVPKSWVFEAAEGDAVDELTLDGVRLVAAPMYEERCEVMEIDG